VALKTERETEITLTCSIPASCIMLLLGTQTLLYLGRQSVYDRLQNGRFFFSIRKARSAISVLYPRGTEIIDSNFQFREVFFCSELRNADFSVASLSSAENNYEKSIINYLVRLEFWKRTVVAISAPLGDPLRIFFSLPASWPSPTSPAIEPLHVGD